MRLRDFHPYCYEGSGGYVPNVPVLMFCVVAGLGACSLANDCHSQLGHKLERFFRENPGVDVLRLGYRHSGLMQPNEPPEMYSGFWICYWRTSYERGWQTLRMLD